MTKTEFDAEFETLDEDEKRMFLSFQHFTRCADCGRMIASSTGRRKRCSACNALRIANRARTYNAAYKSTHYQDFVGS